jgi:alpha-glucosidase
VLSNHDVDRHVSRYGRADTSFGLDRRDHGQPVDVELGSRRARAAALLTMALPGSVYIYQGEELGLWEVEDIPDERRQDPIWHRTGGADPGRDGSRVPLPWAGQEPPFGFSPPGATGQPWLPQPKEWRELTVEIETGDPESMLELYRRALRIRRTRPGLGDGTLRWLDAPDGALAFARDLRFLCVVNVSADPVPAPEGVELLISSGPLSGEHRVPQDVAAWFER